MRRIFVVLNARAGTFLDHGVEQIRDGIRAALSRGGAKVDVKLASGSAFTRALDAAVAGDYDTIVVGGGDGSVSYAVRRLAGSDKTLGVVPCGTINLLARDLGMPGSIDAAIEALSETEPQRIDLAFLNGRPFHTLSGIGFFAEMARAREETRGFVLGRLAGAGLAALRAMHRTGVIDIAIDADGKRRNFGAAAVLVTNNRFAPDWRRPSLQSGKLEMHVAEEQGVLDKIRTGADLLAGTWRDNEGIRSYSAREIVLRPRGRHAWVSTDGELSREASPLHYELRPAQLTVLVHRPGEEKRRRSENAAVV
ncbi:MAG: hypothetical protein QOD74_1043 [Variibacter sp.]|jgi:diacylglycerol kinase family enzyme|nr:hypothetical protein [Variibacter sp.]